MLSALKHHESDQPNINTITSTLVKKTNSIYKQMREERQLDQKIDRIIKSLSYDKNIQRELEDASDCLPKFLEFLQSFSSELLRELKIPVFDGSLLLSPRKRKGSGEHVTAEKNYKKCLILELD